MKKFIATFTRTFYADFEAGNIEAAAVMAQRVVAQFPKDVCKLVSIYAEDYVEPPEPEIPAPPRNKPPSGTPRGGSNKVPSYEQFEAYLRAS